jgi:hypothetical protein
METIKYIVAVDYKEFIFINASEALTFAASAARHQAGPYNVSIKLEIDNSFKDEEEKGETENGPFI